MILFVLIASSCANIQAPDVPICKELDPQSGYCTHTISNKSQIVDDVNKLDGKTWWEHRPYLVSMPPSSWEEIKKTMVKICTKFQNDCAENKIDSIIERVDKVSVANKQSTRPAPTTTLPPKSPPITGVPVTWPPSPTTTKPAVVIAPIPAQAYAWSGKHKDSKQWESFAKESIQTHMKSQLGRPLEKSEEFCPKYDNMSVDLQSEFWVHLLSKLMQWESGYNPAAWMAECAEKQCNYQGGCDYELFPKKDGTKVMGYCMKGGHKLDNNVVISRGLIQMSLESAQSLKCPFTTPEEIYDPKKNIDCFYRAAARYISQDNQLVGRGADGNWKGVSRYWSPMRKTIDKKTGLTKESYVSIKNYLNNLAICK